MTQLPEIRSNDPARAACALRLYLWFTVHALSSVGRLLVWSADARQDVNRPVKTTSCNMMGGSVAESVNDHGSDTVGCTDRDAWLCNTAFRTMAGLCLSVSPESSSLSVMCLPASYVSDDLGRAMSVARLRAVRGADLYTHLSKAECQLCGRGEPRGARIAGFV
jgi:hypothetical protein